MTQKVLTDFLKTLAQDPAKKREYLANPQKVMDAHGVDPAHQKMIMDSDMDSLKKVLGPDATLIMAVGAYKQ